MPTNAELSSQFAALQQQLTNFMLVMPTKDDVAKLATKEEINQLATKDEIKSEFEKFKIEIRNEIDKRFAEYKEEQSVIINDLQTRVAKNELKLEMKCKELDAQRLLDLKFSYRINSLLVGVPEKEGSWAETPSECRVHVQKYLDIMLPDSSKVDITDCHRLGNNKPKQGDLTARGIQKARPIIFKVKDFFQVRMIRDNLEKLKKHFEANPQENRVFIKPHIPKTMFLQRAKLQPEFQKLYDAGQNPKWVLDRGTAEYRIVVKKLDE